MFSLCYINLHRIKVRYHHDGKYNVLSFDGPFEVYGKCRTISRYIPESEQCPSAVSKPTALDFPSVRECLVHIVPLCLDSDPYLMPLSCGGTQEPADSGSDVSRDVDDFSFWSERQAKRICSAIEQAFGVEYAPEVVMADANLTALANRILVSKQMLVP